jgi:hypothetical protein
MPEFVEGAAGAMLVSVEVVVVELVAAGAMFVSGAVVVVVVEEELVSAGAEVAGALVSVDDVEPMSPLRLQPVKARGKETARRQRGRRDFIRRMNEGFGLKTDLARASAIRSRWRRSIAFASILFPRTSANIPATFSRKAGYSIGIALALRRKSTPALFFEWIRRLQFALDRLEQVQPTQHDRGQKINEAKVEAAGGFHQKSFQVLDGADDVEYATGNQPSCR